MATTHHLKCWKDSFQATKAGKKGHEYRQDDRDYQVGDRIILEEWDEKTEDYTDETLEKIITYITRGPDFGVLEGFCVMTVVDPFNPKKDSYVGRLLDALTVEMQHLTEKIGQCQTIKAGLQNGYVHEDRSAALEFWDRTKIDLLARLRKLDEATTLPMKSESEDYKQTPQMHTFSVITEITNERTRQITDEAFTLEHDDEYQEQELAKAAACYAAGDLIRHSNDIKVWPLGHEWWKPKDLRRRCVVAAALLVAQIERVDRNNKS